MIRGEHVGSVHCVAKAYNHTVVLLQLQSVGLQSRPTGDRVAGHLAASPPEVEKERIVRDANRHHNLGPTHLEENVLAAAAAGLSKVGPLLEWNNIAANEVRVYFQIPAPTLASRRVRAYLMLLCIVLVLGVVCEKQSSS